MLRLSAVLTLAAALGTLAVTPVAGQERPAAVTDSAVARGSVVFHDGGGCAECHGEAGVGSALAPALNDNKWKSGSGTYQEILERVIHGKPRRETETGQPMPMRGVSELSERDVRAVAAYVWFISHPQG